MSKHTGQNLLREIQESATGVDVPLTVLLRECKVLAKRLGNDQLDSWVDHELDGYAEISTLPNYRVLGSEVRGDFSGWGGSQFNNALIPPMCVDADDREFLFTIRFMDGVAHYEQLLKAHARELQNPWPADLVVHYSRRIYEDRVCLSAWRVVPPGAIPGLLDTVRSRVLSFALEVEADSPNAGEAPVGSEPIPQDRVNQHFNTYIMGGQNVWSAGSRASTQNVCQVTKGDWASLRKALGEVGVSDVDIDALELAVREDKASGSNGSEPGPAVLGWLGGITTRIASGAIAVSNNETAGGIVAGLVLAFLGNTS